MSIGTVVPTRDEAERNRFLAKSPHPVEDLLCWSAQGAHFRLWVVNELHAARGFRLTGKRSSRED